MENIFNLQKESKRKAIRDRGIKWEETYHKRSEPMKKRFERDVGPRILLSLGTDMILQQIQIIIL